MTELGPDTELSERGRLERILPESIERQTFIRQDYVELKGLWSASFAEALSSEARYVLSATGRSEPRQSPDSIERGLTAPSRKAAVDFAPLLVHLHLSLVPLARALTGRMLVQAHAWYNFYTNDDGLWLHVDEGSELVLLSTVFGDTGSLHLHPELRGRTQGELEAIQIDPNWKTESGVRIGYPRLGLLAHRGHIVPHHRPSRPVAEPCAVAALHYSSLF